MEQLQELPKAEKFLKEYVALHAEQLIKQSEDLATKYLSEREKLLNKEKESQNSRKKIEDTLLFLQKMLNIPEHLRQNIQEMEGMKDQELEELKKTYEEVLSSYGPTQQQPHNHNQEMESPLNTRLSSWNLTEHLQKEQLPDSRKSLFPKITAISLKILQGATFFICIAAVLYRIFLD